MPTFDKAARRPDPRRVAGSSTRAGVTSSPAPSLEHAHASHDSVLGLQRSAGNAATSAFLGRQVDTGASASVQRLLVQREEADELEEEELMQRTIQRDAEEDEEVEDDDEEVL